MITSPRRLAWLPFADRADAERRIGPLPDDLDYEWLPEGTLTGERFADVNFFVVPYLKGAAPLARGAEMTHLEAVVLQSAGYEDALPHVPAHAALCNAAGVHDASTAEMGIALILASGRQLDVYARQQTAHAWDRYFGRSLADQRVLIFGYGHIGKAVERRLAGFETASITKVASHARDDIHGADELASLLPETDVVVLIAPLTEQTRHVMNAETLALLPDGALVVNIGRGALVDTDALVAETTSGRLRAALDVTDPEPLPAQHPLWDIPNVVITPHIAGMSSAFRPRVDAMIKAQLNRWYRGEPLENVVKAGS